MEIKYFIIILGFIMQIRCTEGDKKLMYFAEGRTWVEARNICRNLNGKLMRSTRLNRNIINNCPEIEYNKRFWVGEYKTLSPWFEIVGCFDDDSISSNKTYDNSIRNEVSVCHKICNDSTYVGLKGDKCYCLGDDIIQNGDGMDQTCGYRCPGNSGEYCGGINTVNVYRLARFTPSEDLCPFGEICLCSQMDCQMTGVAYTARPCHEKQFGACDHGYLTDTADAWTDANNRCKDQGYLTNQENAHAFCRNRLQSWPESYWAGVFRSDIDNVDQSTGLVNDPLLYCFTLTKGTLVNSPANDLRDMDTCYSTVNPFVCEIGVSTFGEATCTVYKTAPPTFEPTTSTSTTREVTTYFLGKNIDNTKNIDTGMIAAIAAGAVVLIIGFIVAVVVFRNKRLSAYGRRYKNPYIIRSYDTDLNIDATSNSSSSVGSPELIRNRTNQNQPHKPHSILRIPKNETGSRNSPSPRSVSKSSTNPMREGRTHFGTNSTLRDVKNAEIYVVSSDGEGNETTIRPKPKKGIMKKTGGDAYLSSVIKRHENDSGIEDTKEVCKRTYDADNSSFSDDSLTKFKQKRNGTLGHSKPHVILRPPHKYVYSDL